MNSTVIQLTRHSLLGRRRVFALLGLPAVLLALAILIRSLLGVDSDLAVDLMGAFALGTLMPLLGLIAGTGAIGPEIDDGSILYILSKPLRRSTIVLSKLLVAIATVFMLGVVPVFATGVILGSEVHPIAISYAVGALIAGVAYCALFLLLAIVTRNAVVIGLMYALVWESVVGQIVPGAQALSIQQWSLAIAERVAGEQAIYLGIESTVELRTAIILLVAVIVGCTWLATRRLRTLRLSEEG
ncbi:MAG: transporter permease [Thermoleophilia bacterium]|nr:transporter permease [Thermoleophilia bacterium]MCZ4496032.1 transporter permease [Thermoleophilia bacterium]